jgi:hypothetical protein
MPYDQATMLQVRLNRGTVLVVRVMRENNKDYKKVFATCQAMHRDLTGF